MCQWPAASRHLYRVTVEPGKAAKLCVFILGMQFLYPGVLRRVFGFWCALSVLVIGNCFEELPNAWVPFQGVANTQELVPPA